MLKNPEKGVVLHVVIDNNRNSLDCHFVQVHFVLTARSMAKTISKNLVRLQTRMIGFLTILGSIEESKNLNSVTWPLHCHFLGKAFVRRISNGFLPLRDLK